MGLSVTIAGASVLARGPQNLGQRIQLETAIARLGSTLTEAFVSALGGLVILGMLGISVTPFLAEKAARAAGEVPGQVADPAPFARFIPGFGESSLDLAPICQVRELVDQQPAQRELRKTDLPPVSGGGY